MTETPRVHINEDILGLSEVEAPYAPTGIKEDLVDGYSRNIASAYDEKQSNTNTHNSIREAVTDAAPKHPISSMTPVIGINPPAGVDVEGVTGSTGATGTTDATEEVTEPEGVTGATGETDSTEGGDN